VPKKVSYDVNKDGVKVAVLTFMKSAWRLGETVFGVVELNDREGRARILKVGTITFISLMLCRMGSNHKFFSPRAYFIALGHARSARIPSVRSRIPFHPHRQATPLPLLPHRFLSLLHAADARRTPRVLHATNASHDIRTRYTLRCHAFLSALARRQAVRRRPGVESASLSPRGCGCARCAGARYGARGSAWTLG